jgi:UDP-N-acetylmuramoyl-L-alanyl-D-glutamate--2,6-diaminopimelate ligase
MGQVAREGADDVIVTSDNPRSEDPLEIIRDILVGAGEDGPRLEVEPDRRLAIRRAVTRARDGDIVLIAGKGHEQGQTFADRTLPFSDADEVRDALRALAGAPA